MRVPAHVPSSGVLASGAADRADAKRTSYARRLARFDRVIARIVLVEKIIPASIAPRENNDAG